MAKKKIRVHYIGMVGAALLVVGTVTALPVSLPPRAEAAAAATVVTPQQKYQAAAAIIKKDLGPWAALPRYTQDLGGRIQTNPSLSAYIDSMTPAAAASDADAVAAYNTVINELAMQLIRLAGMKSLQLDPVADAAKITDPGYNGGWIPIQSFAQKTNSKVLGYTSLTNEAAAIQVLSAAQYPAAGTVLPSDPTLIDTRVAGTFDQMRQFLEDTMIVTTPAYARQEGYAAGVKDAQAGLAKKTDNQMPGMPQEFLAGYEAGWNGTMYGASTDAEQGRQDGFNDGSTGVAKRALTNKSDAYVNAYNNTYEPARKDYDSQFALGETAGKAAGLNNRQPEDMTGRTKGFADGYASGLAAGKTSFDQDYAAGQAAAAADGGQGAAARDISQQSPGFRAGYNDSYAAAKAAFDKATAEAAAETDAGAKQAIEDAVNGTTTVLTDKSEAFATGYHDAASGIAQGRIDGSAGRPAATLTDSKPGFVLGYQHQYPIAHAQYESNQQQTAQEGVDTALADLANGTTTNLDTKSEAFAQAYTDAKTGFLDGKAAAQTGQPTTPGKDKSAAYVAGFNQGVIAGTIKPTPPNPAKDKTAGANQALADIAANNNGTNVTPDFNGKSTNFQQGYNDVVAGFKQGQEDAQAGKAKADVSADTVEFGTGYDKGFASVIPTPTVDPAKDKAAGADQALADIIANKNNPSVTPDFNNQSADFQQGYNDVVAGFKKGQEDAQAGKPKADMNTETPEFGAGYDKGFASVTPTPTVDPVKEKAAGGDQALADIAANKNNPAVTPDFTNKTADFQQGYHDTVNGFKQGQEDAQAGKPKADVSTQTSEFGTGYAKGFASVTPTPTVDPVKEAAAGATQAVNDLLAGMTQPNFKDKTPAFVAGYNDAKKGFTQGTDDAAAGKTKANVSKKTTAFQSGYDQGFSHQQTIQQPIDAAAGAKQAVTDLTNGQTTNLDGRSAAFVTGYTDAKNGFNQGKLDGLAGKAKAEVSKTPLAYQTGYAQGFAIGKSTPSTNGGGWIPVPTPVPTPVPVPVPGPTTTVLFTEEDADGAVTISNASGAGLYADFKTASSLGRTLAQGSAWRIYKKVFDNNHQLVAYNLGGSQYVRAGDAALQTAQRAGIFTVAFAAHPTWGIAVYNGNGRPVKIIAAGTRWVTYGQRTLGDGRTYYNLGGVTNGCGRIMASGLPSNLIE